jgi:hypothetical protein
MQTKTPKTAAIFQIKNPADEGTQESTNLCILTFETTSPKATATFEKMFAKLRVDTPKPSKHGAWRVFIHDATQGKRLYHVRDAARDVPGAHVLIRLAWPKLPRNSPRYYGEMETTFLRPLDSVKGGLGPKPRTGGEVL